MVHYIAQAFCVRRDGSVASRKVVNLVCKLLGVDRHDGPRSTTLARSSHSASSRLSAVHEPLWSAHGDCEAWGPIYSRAHFCHHVWSPFMKGDARRFSLHGLGSSLESAWPSTREEHPDGAPGPSAGGGLHQIICNDLKNLHVSHNQHECRAPWEARALRGTRPRRKHGQQRRDPDTT